MLSEKGREALSYTQDFMKLTLVRVKVLCLNLLLFLLRHQSNGSLGVFAKSVIPRVENLELGAHSTASWLTEGVL